MTYRQLHCTSKHTDNFICIHTSLFIYCWQKWEFDIQYHIVKKNYAQCHRKKRNALFAALYHLPPRTDLPLLLRHCNLISLICLIIGGTDVAAWWTRTNAKTILNFHCTNLIAAARQGQGGVVLPSQRPLSLSTHPQYPLTSGSPCRVGELRL